MPRRRYTDDIRERFRREMSLPGARVCDVAARLGLPINGTTYRWAMEDRQLSTPQPMTVCALLSDWHIGAIVESSLMRGMYAYDTDICESRIDTLCREIRSMIALYGKTHRIESVNLLWAGDIIDGINAYRGQRYRLQLTTPKAQRHWALPRLVRFIEDIAAEAIKVTCLVVAGNHGRASAQEEQPAEANEELRLFEEVARATEHLSNVVWWHHLIGIAFDVLGHGVYVEHGQRVPWGGRASQPTPGTWQHAHNICVDEGRLLEVVCWGHRHTPVYLHGRPHILSNGCLSGYNEFARELHLRPTLPGQWVFGITPAGLVWAHNVVLGTWPETTPDALTSVLSGALHE